MQMTCSCCKVPFCVKSAEESSLQTPCDPTTKLEKTAERNYVGIRGIKNSRQWSTPLQEASPFSAVPAPLLVCPSLLTSPRLVTRMITVTDTKTINSTAKTGTIILRVRSLGVLSRFCRSSMPTMTQRITTINVRTMQTALITSGIEVLLDSDSIRVNPGCSRGVSFVMSAISTWSKTGDEILRKSLFHGRT